MKPMYTSRKQQETREQRFENFIKELKELSPNISYENLNASYTADGFTVIFSPSYAFNMGRFGSQSSSFFKFRLNGMYEVEDLMSISRKRMNMRDAYSKPKKFIKKLESIVTEANEANGIILRRKKNESNKKNIAYNAFRKKFPNATSLTMVQKNRAVKTMRVSFDNGMRYSFPFTVSSNGIVNVYDYTVTLPGTTNIEYLEL